jgi:hypothetical protein
LINWRKFGKGLTGRPTASVQPGLTGPRATEKNAPAHAPGTPETAPLQTVVAGVTSRP